MRRVDLCLSPLVDWVREETETVISINKRVTQAHQQITGCTAKMHYLKESHAFKRRGDSLVKAVLLKGLLKRLVEQYDSEDEKLRAAQLRLVIARKHLLDARSCLCTTSKIVE